MTKPVQRGILHKVSQPREQANSLIPRLLLGILALLAMLAGIYILRFQAAIFVTDKGFEQVKAEIAQDFELRYPNEGSIGSADYPVVLLFHGCGGNNQRFHKARAERLLAQGYAVMFVDSYSGRNIAWQDTCAGRVMHGTQRAADVLVALDYVKSQPRIDPGHIVLMGYSHGAWSVLDALSYASAGQLPRGLQAQKPGLWEGVRGIIAYYPYCGLPTRLRHGWSWPLPVLLLLGENDQTTDPLPCIDVAETLRARGLPVELVVYPNAGHGFDVKAGWVQNFDPAVQQDAWLQQDRFLARLAALPQHAAGP